MSSGERLVPAAEPTSILSKAFDLMRAFNSDSRVMTLSELSRASGLPKSTVHRLIARLVDLGAVEQHRTGYVVSVDLLQLAANTPAGGMRDLALPALAALHRWSGHGVQLAVLRQFDVVYLEKIATHRMPAPRAGIGARLPANCTALGKVLLAWENIEDLDSFLPRPMSTMTTHSTTDVDELLLELQKIRSAGIAREREESQLGLACVAVPIVIHDFAVGAVAVSHSADVDVGSGVDNALRATAAQIARLCRDDLSRGKFRYFPREL
ncbi:IclR family transcriptional regulator [Pseudonocardia pini]|uniref:IclR family transcriptional regulator n=1 Tax=Pseudonocardia pini TaxID=2758030 RepID=UPI0015F10C85|nr:IclR family transcriptional regulator [Pseudonocardia pini]